EWVTLPAPRLNRVDRNLELVAALGVAEGPDEATIPESAAEATEAAAIRAGIAPTGPCLVVSPGVSRRQWYKAWPASHYAAFARLLAARSGIRPVVVWGPGEEALARAVVEAAGGAAVLAPPTTLRTLLAL